MATNLSQPESPHPRSFSSRYPGDWMYAYACQVQNLACSWHLARVPIAAALDRPKWWFFAGSERWSSDWKDAQTLLEGGITWRIPSVHWNLFLDTFPAIDSRVADARIANRVEDRRVGPWTDAGLGLQTSCL